MADNVRIVGQVLNRDQIDRYSIEDEQLLRPVVQQETFGRSEDYIEYFVFDLGGNIIDKTYNYTSYKLPSNSGYQQDYLPIIEIDPIQDIKNLGFESGEVTSRYNFFRKVVGESSNPNLFISQISSDRTELKVNSTLINNISLLDIASNFADKQLSVPYYYYFILNFGDNNQVIVVNVLSEVTDLGEASLLFKLYEPLPANIALKTSFWIVEEIINPYIYGLNLDKFITPPSQPFLKGPNFNIDLEFKTVIPTKYNNLTQLVTSFTGSSYQAVLNSLTNQEINLNVDYSSLNGFIHYSSAVSRINNFMFKIGEIEGYKYQINAFSPLTASNASLINQINQATSSLNTTIAKFDGFESYLYYNSSSLTSSIVQYNLETGSYLSYNIAPYPKSNTSQPYNLYASSSTTVSNWYRDAIDIADNYDVTNKDILVNTIPSYILDDPGNYLPYTVFVNMIGQYFDNIWVYIDNLTDVWDNNNNLNEGISQDLVYDWLKSFGVKLYNSQKSQNILDYNIGSLSGSTVFAPNCRQYRFSNGTSSQISQPYVDCNGVAQIANFSAFAIKQELCALSGSIFPVTAGLSASDRGVCYDGNYSPSSSFLNNVPKKDLLLDTYKRIYHNLPYLFKGKGAHGGLQGLITLFGITGSILPIKEYGGTNDYQDLKGYSPNKITLGSNNLTGSILSPIKRFETSTTSSREVKSQDLHFVDVSFSPQTQIDNSVSASITAVNPNWVIDNYIAYPEALYLDTYPSLSFQRDYWFGQTFTHPSEGFDYNGFIRLIQFFDNSLFKMVQDFTPARSNTWTGVSIKSPVLERPKVPEARPLFTSEVDLEGNIEGVNLSSIYDPYYFDLAENREPYYTGDITGSTLDTYEYFEEVNVNPYLVNNTANYVAPGSKLFVLDPQCRQYLFTNTSAVSTRSDTYLDCSGSSQTVTLTPLSSATICAISGSYLPLTAGLTATDLGVCPTGNYISSGDMDFILNHTAPYYENFFENSDFNAVQNNVNESLTSQLRKKLTPVFSLDSLGRAFTSYSVTESVQLQDSYLSNTSYLNSRHDGVRLHGKQYNNWYIGDISYGLTPVIDYNTKKIGLFTEVTKSIIPNKSNVALKYLVDESGKLIELNQRNRNWEEVQNTFKTGDLLNVSLFNSQQYSNQFATNGNKVIHESGYSYSPILYYSGIEAANPNTLLPFFDSTNALGLASVNFFNKKLSTRQIPLPGMYSNPLVTIGSTDIPQFNNTSSFTTESGVWTEVWDIFNPTQSAPPGQLDENGRYREIGWSGINNDFSIPSPIFIPFIPSLEDSYIGSYLYPGKGPGVVDINSAKVTSSYYIIPTEGEYDFTYAFDVGVFGDAGATFTSSLELWVSSSITGNVTFITRDSQSVKIPPSSFVAVETTIDVKRFLDNRAASDGFLNELEYMDGFDIPVLNGDRLSIVPPPTDNSSVCQHNIISQFLFSSDRTFKKYKYKYWIRNGSQTDLTNQDYQQLQIIIWSDSPVSLSGTTAVGSWWLNFYGYFRFTACDTTRDYQYVKHNKAIRIRADGNTYKPGDKIVFKYLMKTTSFGSNKIQQAGIKYYTKNTLNEFVPSFLSVVPSATSTTTPASICNDQTNNALILDPQFLTFYSPNFYFYPTYAPFLTFFSSSINELGDVSYPFQLSPYDRVIVEVGANGGIYFDYTIRSVETNVDGNLAISLFEDLDSRMVDTLCNTFYKIYFLKRVRDETNVILNLRKPLGKTSYGLIISSNISSKVLDNIDNITKNVKLQLPDAGSNIIS